MKQPEESTNSSLADHSTSRPSIPSQRNFRLKYFSSLNITSPLSQKMEAERKREKMNLEAKRNRSNSSPNVESTAEQPKKSSSMAIPIPQRPGVSLDDEDEEDGKVCLF